MKNIEVTSSQNVLIEYQAATLMERFGAWLLDYICMFVTWLLFIWMYNIVGDSIPYNSVTQTLFNYFIACFLWLGVVIYHFLTETLWAGQSIGKRAVGLRVIKSDGTEPSLGDHLTRAILLLLDVFTGFLGATLILISPKKQRLGDIMANTVVVRLRGRNQFRLDDILDISTRDTYQPTYERAIQLREQDVVVMKQCITRYERTPNAAHWEAVVNLSEKVAPIVGVNANALPDRLAFLRTVLRDYIVITRS